MSRSQLVHPSTLELIEVDFIGMIVIAAFYHFFAFPNYQAMRQPLLDEMNRLGVKGSLLIASEGINGTLSGDRNAIDRYLDYLKSHVTMGEFEHKESRNDRHPFGRAKVRLKKEIISMGESVSPERTGRFVDARNWNALIADPEVVVIDARNSYEVHLGTFDRALDPHTKSFKELPAYVAEHLNPAQHRKIATFCTGGIRCEKFSAWLIEQGFEEVYQLRGGILRYLEEIPEAESSWKGECYVFDERIAVGHGLTPSSTASMCPGCGRALTEADRNHEHFNQGAHCSFCFETSSG